jgi:hypothetical protein
LNFDIYAILVILHVRYVVKKVLIVSILRIKDTNSNDYIFFNAEIFNLNTLNLLQNLYVATKEISITGI